MGRLIDEDDVLNVLCHELCHPGAICPDGYCEEMREKLKEVPAADAFPRWIPCSERLPEEDTDVLIAYRYKEGEGDTTHSYIEITSYGDMYFGGNPVHESGTGNRVKHWRPPFAYFVSNYEVIAWMPLPEPYKEEN